MYVTIEGPVYRISAKHSTTLISLTPTLTLTRKVKKVNTQVRMVIPRVILPLSAREIVMIHVS